MCSSIACWRAARCSLRFCCSPSIRAPPRHRHHAPNSQNKGQRQQRELSGELTERGTALARRMLLGGLERALRDREHAGEARHRVGRPLVGGHFRRLAGHQRLQDSVTRRNVIGREIDSLRVGNGVLERTRQTRAERRVLQRRPRGLAAAHEAQVPLERFRRRFSSRQALRHDQRRLAGRVAQDPGDLLQLQHLIDEWIDVFHRRNQPRRNLLQKLEQLRFLGVELLRQALAAGRLRLGHRVPGFTLQGGHRLHRALQLGLQARLLGEVDALQRVGRCAQRRHLSIADVLQIGLQVRGNRVRQVQATHGRRAVRAQPMHGLESVARRGGDTGDPAGRGIALPRAPGAQGQDDHHRACHAGDD